MPETKKLSQEIKKRMKRSQEEKNQRLIQVAEEMKQLLKQQENFNKIAGGIFSSVVYLRMRELAGISIIPRCRFPAKLKTCTAFASFLIRDDSLLR